MGSRLKLFRISLLLIGLVVCTLGRAEGSSLYEILEMNRSATQKEIKRAYRKLAHRWHPDHNPGNLEAEERFKAINNAYEILGNPEKKAEFDRRGSFVGLDDIYERMNSSPSKAISDFEFRYGQRSHTNRRAPHFFELE